MSVLGVKSTIDRDAKFSSGVQGSQESRRGMVAAASESKAALLNRKLKLPPCSVPDPGADDTAQSSPKHSCELLQCRLVESGWHCAH